MPTDRNRELARRHHRMIAQYAATFAAVHRLNCVIVDHDTLSRVLGIVRWDPARIRWVQEDAFPWFDHVVPRFSTAPSEPLAAMVLSQVALPEEIRIAYEDYATRNQVYALSDLAKPIPGVRAASLGHEPELTEHEMLRRLVSWATGVVAPDEDTLPSGSYQDDLY